MREMAAEHPAGAALRRGFSIALRSKVEQAGKKGSNDIR